MLELSTCPSYPFTISIIPKKYISSWGKNTQLRLMLAIVHQFFSSIDYPMDVKI